MSSTAATAADEPVDNVRALHGQLHERRREMRRIDVEIDDITGHLNAQHGRLVDVAIWLLAHPQEWASDGVWKPEQYLAWRCGVAVSTARKVVELARRADELPATIAAVRAGELSIDQAAPIAARVPGWADERVVSLAKRLTVRQIQRTVAQYPFHDDRDPSAGDDPDPSPDDPAGERSDDGAEPHPGGRGADHVPPAEDSIAAGATNADAVTSDQPADPPGSITPDDRCWWGVGDDGRWRLFVETTRDVGDVIGAALDEARDHLVRRSDRGIDGVTPIDALTEMASRSLDAVESASRRDRHRINIHLHTDGTATDPLGIPLPDSIRRHLTCDGTLSPTFVEQALPISVGRNERIVPERTRRIVLLRDGGCRVPGCTAQHHLEIHHIIHWSDDGPTDTWNLVALCARHHRLHHQGKLGIGGDADRPDGLTFTTADGRPLRPSGARPNPPSGPPPPITGTYEHPLGERLDSSYVDFHPPPVSPPTWARPRAG